MFLNNCGGPKVIWKKKKLCTLAKTPKTKQKTKLYTIRILEPTASKNNTIKINKKENQSPIRC